MLREQIAIRTLLPNRPPADLYEPHAREIAKAVLPQPAPCCADQECDAYTASMRWWRVQIGLRRSISALTDLIDSHDATETANCVIGSASVELVSANAAYRRRYDGELVTIHADGEHVLAVTPNHPVLTYRGWQAAGRVQKGDYLVGGRLTDRAAMAAPDVNDVPTTCEEMFAFLSRRGVVQRVSGARSMFHGDGTEAEINVVWPNSELRHEVVAARTQPPAQDMFSGSDVLRAESLLGCRDTRPSFGAAALTTARGMGGRSEGFPLLSAQSAHPEHLCFVDASDLNTTVDKAPTNGRATDLERNAQGLFAFTKYVAAHKVIHVERSAFSGHVYNFSTDQGWYIANGIVTHNCRCRNVVESRAMRGALVVLWQRTGRLLEQMRAQAAALEAAEKGDE
jgi:hypothetical protein